MAEKSLQDLHFPDGTCFGCGPANAAGLRLKSFPREDGSLVARWTAGAEHGNGGAGTCGGILASLLDCHACITAMRALNEDAEGEWRYCLTKDFSIEFLQLAPLRELELVARVVQQRSRSAEIEATAGAGGETYARLRGVFVMPRAAG